MSDRSAPPAQVTFAEAVAFWLKLGFISFGGPTGQIAIMHTELVERRRWISERRFLHALNFCMVLPGPEAQQLATYIGWLLHGTRGALVAGGLFVLPSLVLLIALSWIYLAYGSLPLIAGVLDGMKPAVVAIVAFAAIRIGSRVLTTPLLWTIAGAAFIALFYFNVPFPYIVILAGALGFVLGRVRPTALQTAPAHHHSPGGSTSALIGDNDPPPAHARFRWTRVGYLAAITLALWAAVEGALVLLFGIDSTFAQMGWFFSKAALLTVGGAYAVLPYVQQAAVEQFGWLTATQMIDGLALGETTPGPLIMIVSFVGFVGGWTHLASGIDSPALAGIIAASVATFFTFLPSFAFILIGAPAVEATRDEISFTGPLTAITAAVVGVILNLAVYFAGHVLLQSNSISLESIWGDLNWFAALLCVIALIALTRFKANVIWVIAGCAAAGLLRTFVMQHSSFAV